MSNTATATAMVSGVSSAAVAHQMTTNPPSIMRAVLIDFGEYALYAGDLLTIVGIGVAVLSARAALKRPTGKKDGS
ncbi:hypothetical protein [Vibrio sp. SCSIO 43136]|uniref:hypothetical protein n=1 Tax=Vibrio sp. SCSIO 43136 TaxID=2819101 RepID=UPI0020764317|nr:hypothetical protein [Vibrio sp. SCSIO 43136]USD64225.1 hypothetical protein J4N39_08890 [Vibrio sp. SCSIO 43136]